MTVWPFLLLGSAVCAYWNWRAGLAFAICILLVRAGIYYELNNPILYRMVLYSVTAFVVLFLVDRIAGGFFAVVSILLIAALFGFVEIKVQVIASEAVLVLGMFASAFFGPTGGLFDPLRSDRHHRDLPVSQSHTAAPDSVD